MVSEQLTNHAKSMVLADPPGNPAKSSQGMGNRLRSPLARPFAQRFDPAMSVQQTVLVLGANGRFGRVARQAFADAGWHVLAQARGPLRGAGDPRIRHLAFDADRPAAIAREARGAAVVVNALNPPYTRWEQEALALNEAALAVARELGATLMLPGNVYNYGAAMPPTVTEATPEAPTTRKGQIRCAMEARMRAGCERSLVVRAGDFFGGPAGGSWLDLVIAKDLRRGRLTYPGPLDRPHAWAYLPDLARCLVLVAQRRAELPAHAQVLHPGYTVTGEQLLAAITEAARALGVLGNATRVRVRTLPWAAVRVAGLVHPMMREIGRMRYLWQVPHAIDGQGLQRIVGHVASTPLPEAMRDALAALLAGSPR